MRRLSTLVWVALLAVVVSGATAVSASSVRSAAPAFTITRLDMPVSVTQNGARGTRSIAWDGHPTFPVTVHERGLCPESVNCGPRGADGFGKVVTTVFTAAANPLVTPHWYYCNGSSTSSYVVGIEVWLTDAHGHKTPIARNFWECKTH
ncbi:MAG TPA: hypothetical protein VFA82_01965 [Gaiellaceae bacterium]|nr:hypothetical protein [Gaiellaceae bacterium]